MFRLESFEMMLKTFNELSKDMQDKILREKMGSVLEPTPMKGNKKGEDDENRQ